MDIDIPLPGEEVPISEIEPPDIPMPDIPMPDSPEPPRRIISPTPSDSTTSEPSQGDLDSIDPPLPPEPAPDTSEDEAYDPNRYSPSVPMEDDDIPIIELPTPTVIPPLLPPPPPPPSLAPLPPTAAPRSPSPEPPPPPVETQARSLVLGKTQAKKRLLAFSMTKQGGGAGVSFNLAKKAAINKEGVKGFSEENKDEAKKKPPKKGSVDKARDTISEIEELKRKEQQLLENMHAVHPKWGLIEAHNLPSALPLQLAGTLEATRSVDIFDLVGEVLAKKTKREAEREKELVRNKSPSDDRRRSKSKRSDKEKERSRKRHVLPKSWDDFKKEGHKMHHFRRFKYEVEKHNLREKKRHKRSRSSHQSRSKRSSV